MPWNPDRYLQFKGERYRPFEDLVALVPIREGMRVVDLGCGTGELTRRLADALPGSEVVGIDNSAEMLERAREYARPGLAFERDSIEDVAGSWDLVFSHAAIQWVDDHHALVPRLLTLLAPGGRLAVQLPANHNHASHRIIRQTAGDEPFRSALEGWTREPQALTIEEYAELLHARGGADITVMAKVYPHVLDDADAIADWMQGTAMVPYLDRLPESLREPFLQEARRRLRRQFPGSPVFFGFTRILFAATKA